MTLTWTLLVALCVVALGSLAVIVWSLQREKPKPSPNLFSEWEGEPVKVPDSLEHLKRHKAA